MDKKQKAPSIGSKIRTAEDLPQFSSAQIDTFNSKYVDGMDEALAVLDETNKTTIGQTKSFDVNKK